MIYFESDSILKIVKKVYSELVPTGLRSFDTDLEKEESAAIVLTPSVPLPEEAVHVIGDRLHYSFDFNRLFPYAREIVTRTGEDIVSYEMSYWNDDLMRSCAEAPEGRLPHVVELLRENPKSRRAVVALWQAPQNETTPNAPCVTHIVFRVKDQFLEMHSHLRANDICFLLFMDIQVMSGIHAFVAEQLNLQKGDYTHFVDSMHYHKTRAAIVRKQYRFILDSKEWADI